MPRIVQGNGTIADGNDLQYTSVNNYKDYLLRALNLNGWTAAEVTQGIGGYYEYRLVHPNVTGRNIHVYLKPVVWRHRHEEEKAAQMSADLDMRGFNAITNEDPEPTFSFGIYRDPTASGNPADQTDPYVICAWSPVEWGENHGISSFNYFIRVPVISEAFKFGFATMESSGRRVFAFRPEFIHYYMFNRNSLHDTGTPLSLPGPPPDLDQVPLNQILYGPPGTGKTYSTITKAVEIVNGVGTSEMEWHEIKEAYDEHVAHGRIRFVTFHQSYSYEEFVEGIRPVVDPTSHQVSYNIVDGTFKQLCSDAVGEDGNYVLIIDEINRGNISRIFGELITLIEDTKRMGQNEALTSRLTYSGQNPDSPLFGVPSNVYIIGTMNSADRSIALIDTALRRRFTFYHYPAKSRFVPNDVEGINLRKLFETLNKRIEFLLDSEHQLGHGYFMKVHSKNELASIFRNKIIPLLEEYFYGDYEKIQLVLGDNSEYGKPVNHRMISSSKPSEQRVQFGTEIDGFEDKSLYTLREDISSEHFDDVTIEVFTSIYGGNPEETTIENAAEEDTAEEGAAVQPQLNEDDQTGPDAQE